MFIWNWEAIGVVFSILLGLVNLILWLITKFRKPKLVVKLPRYVKENNVWHIYIYNEGNRATSIKPIKTLMLIDKKEIIGRFRPPQNDYFLANPGAYHHFYAIYEREALELIKDNSKVKISMEVKYEDADKERNYKKRIKLDKSDFLRFIDENRKREEERRRRETQDKQEKESKGEITITDYGAVLENLRNDLEDEIVKSKKT